MRFGTPWRLAVLASVALLASGQLCMLTTCVPRLTRADAETSHACCAGAPTPEAPLPMPSGAMPCGQLVSLTDAPTLDHPSPIVMVIALATHEHDRIVPREDAAVAQIERDTGPAPGVHPTAPTGLRAPPRA